MHHDVAYETCQHLVLFVITGRAGHAQTRHYSYDEMLQ